MRTEDCVVLPGDAEMRVREQYARVWDEPEECGDCDGPCQCVRSDPSNWWVEP